MREGYKYAGAILDFYDDEGATLKSQFPTIESLPEMIKSANVRPREELPNDAFALIMLDEGAVFRKYACESPGTTAMSVVYFMEHGDKLTKEAKEIAATKLVGACLRFDIMPPAAMAKVATMAKVASVVDVTGRLPQPKVVSSRPTDESDYAVKLADGSLHYPIDSWDRIKTAEAYFHEERRAMEPEIRRQFAVKLAAKAVSVGYPVDDSVVILGSTSYMEEGDLRDAVEMRKTAFQLGEEQHQFLDDLFEKRASLHPEVYAECLRQFDVMHGMDRGWDHAILNPWESTFGVKTASIVWEEGAERVTEEELINLARNDPGSLKRQFSSDFLDEFQRDPVAIFNSMPAPQKKLIARMAVDAARSGGSEFMPTSAPEQGGGGHNKSVR
jgi:hypothetical protein